MMLEDAVQFIADVPPVSLDLRVPGKLLGSEKCVVSNTRCASN